MKKLYMFFLLVFVFEKAHSQFYRFLGNGLWSTPANWENNIIPPNPLPAGSYIYIAPAEGDSCILDISQTISPGASLIVTSANFIIASGVVINNVSPQPSTVICNQVWMSKNLSVSAYRNGDPIPQVTDGTTWLNSTMGAWCWYNNDSVSYSKYGKLYNWYAVNDPRGLAPQGWRIPDSLDVDALIRCYGSNNVGGALKDTGTANWRAPNVGATNIFGFTALPAGVCGSGFFTSLGSFTYYWLSGQVSATWGRVITLAAQTTALEFAIESKHIGLSIRCLKDTVVSTSDFPVLTTTPVSSITVNSAVSGGTIISDGGYPVIEKGVVWDTLPNPIFTNTRTVDGSGLTDYTSTMGLLLGNHTYYMRAYARNQLGVGYGNEVSFTTAPVLPATVVTLPVRFFKDTIAYGVGKVTYLGGGSISDIGVVASRSPNPTMADTKFVMTGGNNDSFTVRCGSLLPSTLYYIKAYVVNEAGISFGNEMSFTTASPSPGNVIISNQVWMTKNLDVSHYRNGDPIPEVSTGEWGSLTTGAWCWYNNDSATYASTYGKLYNWYAVNDPRGLAPEGWHIPTRNEWNVMDTIFYAWFFAGGELKEAGTAHWRSPNFGANNISGFTALPYGIRFEDGIQFFYAGEYGYWWGDASQNLYIADMHILSYIGRQRQLSGRDKNCGLAVRCIKD